MILAKTQYKIYNREFLAIAEAFETPYHYFEVSEYEVFVFMDHNNMRYFIDIKSLNSR